MRIQLITAALALLASSCSSTYYSHKFLPAPIEAPSAVAGDASSQARVLVTVIGIRRANRSAGEPVMLRKRPPGSDASERSTSSSATSAPNSC